MRAWGKERSHLGTDSGSVRVNIFNQTYSLRSGDGDGEHVLRVARLVDERMRAVADGLAVHDVAKVAVLTALNLADELEGLKGFYETELRGMLERARAGEEEEDGAEPEAPAALAESHAPAAPAEPDAPGRSGEEPSWFEAIFDSDAPPARAGEERLSSHLSSRLRSQVSSRLRRLRQPSPGNSITEGEGDAES